MTTAKTEISKMSIEDELKQKTARLNAVLSAIPDSMFILDLNGMFIDFYSYDEKGLRLPSEKIKGSSIFDIFPKEEALRHLSIYKECTEDKNLKVVEYEIKKEGTSDYFEARIVSLEDNTILAIVRNITERKKQESLLLENEHKFRELAEMLPEAIFETDLNMFITYANKRAYELFGYDEIGRKFNVISAVAPHDREKAKENTIKRLRGIKESYTEYTGVKSDGSIFPMLLQSAVIMKDGVPVGFRGIIIDLTLQKNTEEAIKRVEKLESIGVLAGGIAHDFNNLLGGLFGTIELAKGELEKGDIDSAKEMLLKSIAVFTRAKDLTLQLLTFSKGGVPVKKSGNISKVVKESVEFALSGSKVKPVFKFENEECLCDFDQGQISQTIENMVINSVQSMPEGGKIEVFVSKENIDDLNTLSLEAGRYLKISIKDEGTGIPERFFKKIFDPFFTTKQSGSGLGLAISWSIIKKHGGTIDVESNIGNGTTFHIYLPFTDQCSSLDEERHHPHNLKGCGKILIMDDDFIIREVTAKILIEAGYEVVKTESGEKALSVYKEHLENNIPICAVLLDLTVPGGMGGKETLDMIREIDTNVVAIATSGYSEDPVISNPKDFGFYDSIPKPYLKSPFLEVIRKAVEGK